MNRLNTVTKDYGMKIKMKKTKVMCMSWKCNSKVPLLIDYQQVEQVSVITATLHDDLHWLQIWHAACILQAAHHGVQVPAYGRSSLSARNVCSCRCQHWAPVPIRSASHGDLTVMRTRTSKYILHSFAVSSPSISNSLLPAIRQSTTLRQFQKQLKTFLFWWTYGTWLSARSRDCLGCESSVSKWNVSTYLLAYLSHFRYLGSWISDDGYVTKDTRAKIAMGKTLFMDKEKLLTGKLNCEQKKRIIKSTL